jgi:hypothetical protein
VTPRRSVQSVPRCLAGAARLDVPAKASLDQRAAYLGARARPDKPLMAAIDSRVGQAGGNMHLRA